MIRVGVGYDVHRLEQDRPLVLGGVTVPHESGLAGHSDADVLTHAIIDALLGAAAMGDIGVHFPDTDEAYRGADSLVLLAEVVQMLADGGYQIQNVDATLAIQRPRMRPFIEKMRARLSGVLGVTPDRVSVKATTGEGLGFVGREEGVAAYAICALESGA